MPWWFRALLPWFRREWPLWGPLYRLAKGRDDARWLGTGTATVRGKLHGYSMPLDLGNWSERLSWSLGRYHDLPLQMALLQVLHTGDCFVDIGANIGMLSLVAHRLVGATGRVIACEPNPRLRGRIEELIVANRLQNVELVAKALGAEEGTAELREFAGHTGWGSLVANGPNGAAATATYRVPVIRGDTVLGAVPASQPTVVKIDVEGFEVPVLRGLAQSLVSHAPLVFVEVADAHQRRAGYSAKELVGELERAGYRGYSLALRRHAVFGRKLAFTPFAVQPDGEVDAMFVPNVGPWRTRIALP